ncbi:MAG: hypothetical protein IPH77_05995 [Ignavibacteria bacterium]|nr:hypothetical protein [Ignavibacteria bacterium]
MPEIDTESFSELKTDKINGNNHTVEKINPLNREDFLPFAYSRNSHIIFFQNKHCDELLYGRRIESWDYDLNTYQNLYAYSFIKDNISEGARILEIGKKDDYIINHFKHQRECYRIENAESLAKNDKDLINISLIKDNHGNETKEFPRSF